MQAKGIKIMVRQIDTNLDPHYLEIAQLALNMTKRFISPHTNTLVITSLCSVHCTFHRRYHRNLLDTFLRDINLNISVKLNFDEPEDKPWEYNLLLVDSWYALKLSIHTSPLAGPLNLRNSTTTFFTVHSITTLPKLCRNESLISLLF